MKRAMRACSVDAAAAVASPARSTSPCRRPRSSYTTCSSRRPLARAGESCSAAACTSPSEARRARPEAAAASPFSAAFSAATRLRVAAASVSARRIGDSSRRAGSGERDAKCGDVSVSRGADDHVSARGDPWWLTRSGEFARIVADTSLARSAPSLAAIADGWSEAITAAPAVSVVASFKHRRAHSERAHHRITREEHTYLGLSGSCSRGASTWGVRGGGVTSDTNQDPLGPHFHRGNVRASLAP